MYKGFLKQNFKIVAAFDIDPVKVVGHISEQMGKPIEILHIDSLKEVLEISGPGRTNVLTLWRVRGGGREEE